MTKYDERFPQKLFDQYLRHEVSFTSLARRHGVGATMLRCWLTAYQLHGSAAFGSKFSPYDRQFRRQVQEHMWREGLSPSEVTVLYDIRGTGRPIAIVARLVH